MLRARASRNRNRGEDCALEAILGTTWLLSRTSVCRHLRVEAPRMPTRRQVSINA